MSGIVGATMNAICYKKASREGVFSTRPALTNQHPVSEECIMATAKGTRALARLQPVNPFTSVCIARTGRGAIQCGYRSGRLATTGLPFYLTGFWGKHRLAFVVAECDCGTIFVTSAGKMSLGQVRSCGCLQRDATGAASTTHGESRGRKHSAEYRIWLALKNRCNNPRFKDYHGRGIKVCARWQESFESFLSDMGRRPTPKHSIDRKDNDGNYEPDNCRWATPTEQRRNNRNTRPLTAFGKTQLLTDWAKETGVNIMTLHARLRRGVPIEIALIPARTTQDEAS